MPTVEVNGARLFYREAGSGHETVVFSHSYMLDSNHFEPQIRALEERRRCIAYDHRGHGRSEAAAAGYSMEGLYSDALGIIETLGCAPCHFIGLSTGGFIGLRLGIRRPDVLRSLVLMDTSADQEPKGNLLKYWVMLWTARLFGIRPLVGQLMPVFFSRDFLKSPRRQFEVRQYRKEFLANNRSALFRFGKGIFSREGVYDQLGGINTPTLVMVGEHDLPTPVEKAERMAGAIPGARLVVVPGAGHISSIEQPEFVNSTIVEFLESLK